MSHEITESDSLFVTRRPAWHKLGTVLDSEPDTDTARRKSGLTWEIVEQPLERVSTFVGVDGNGSPVEDTTRVPIATHKALVRNDNAELLSVQATSYDVLQPRELFDIMAPIVEAGGGTYESAGSVKGGRRVWVLIKLSKTVSVLRGDDEVDLYLLVATSFDGSLATHLRVTPIRVVCWNTLSAATGEIASGKDRVANVGGWKLDDRGIAIRHTANQRDLIEQAKVAIGVAHASFENSALAWEQMAQTHLTAEQLLAYLHEVMPDPKMPARFLNEKHEQQFERRLDRARRSRAKVEELFDGGALGSDLTSARGTLWGAVNAVSEFTDQWDAPRAKDRAGRVVFGESGRTIARGTRAALAVLNG